MKRRPKKFKQFLQLGIINKSFKEGEGEKKRELV